MDHAFGIIGVLMGGPSAERAISLKSGQAVVQALTHKGHRVVPVVLEPTDITAERVAARLHEAACDVAFIALHGTFGEDGALQRILEQLGMPYTGSPADASQLAFDKWRSRTRLQSHGLTVPRAIRMIRPELDTFLSTISQLHRTKWETPLVVKPVHQGSSMGISLVTSPEALGAAFQIALQFDDELLLEQHVRGRELTVAIFDEQALPVVEIRPQAAFFDFEAKYHAESTTYLVPAPLEESQALAVQHAALAAHRALDCRHFSRVDLILADDDTPWVLEVNTIPGLTARSLLPMAAAACGCGFPELCEHMVALALETPPVMTATSRVA